MGQPGSRSKQTATWMLREDAARFGAKVAEEFHDSGWRCSHVGPADRQPKHLHASIIEALECGGIQAFMPLPIGSDPFAHGSMAIIQFLESAVRDDDDSGPCLRAGRLATMWIEPEVGKAAHDLLTNQRDAVWSLLRAATRPAHAEDLSGQPLSGYRIGPEAEAKVIAEGLHLAPMAGWARYRLRRPIKSG